MAGDAGPVFLVAITLDLVAGRLEQVECEQMKRSASNCDVFVLPVDLPYKRMKQRSARRGALQEIRPQVDSFQALAPQLVRG